MPVSAVPLLPFSLLLSFAATAQTPVPRAAMEPGGLYLATDRPDRLLPAPQLEADVEMRIAGPVARVRVTQRFRNPDPVWREAIYTYPLPDGAAVDRLQMQVGQRRIDGVIQEKQAARRTYAKARQAGRRASLVSQHRPNIFSTEVANIGPGETVAIVIEFQDAIPFKDGAFRLAFPMVIRPRYTPGQVRQAIQDRQTGWALPTDQVPDAPAVTPPVDLTPTRHNPLTLTVHLDAGLPLAQIGSDSHKVEITRPAPGRATVRLADDWVPADQDFRLSWRPETGTAPQLGLFRETVEGVPHYLLMLMPPAPATDPSPVPSRDLILVLDKSGSMGGEAIRQAKAATLKALDRLRPQDRLNLIAFDGEAYPLFSAAQPARPDRLAEARAFVNRLEAGGGTEMSKALRLALAGQAEAGRLRQILFVTDGAVGNEAALYRQIEQGLGESRLFTVGISASPNRHFMSEAALHGRGAAVFIARAEAVAEKMADLFAKIETPVMTGLALDWAGADGVRQHPGRLPDLYAGAPLFISLAADRPGTALRVSGMRGGVPWQAGIDAAAARQSRGVAALWARARIQSLERDGHRGRLDRASVDAQILRTALAYRLVSRRTALVAVDPDPVRPPDKLVWTQALPTAFPAGLDPDLWDPARLAGRGPFARLDGAVALPAAPYRLGQGAADMVLPRTDQGSDFKLLIGLILVASAWAGLGLRRWHR